MVIFFYSEGVVFPLTAEEIRLVKANCFAFTPVPSLRGNFRCRACETGNREAVVNRSATSSKLGVRYWFITKGSKAVQKIYGDVAERFKAPVLKTDAPTGAVSSNLTISAKKKNISAKALVFF